MWRCLAARTAGMRWAATSYLAMLERPSQHHLRCRNVVQLRDMPNDA